MAVGLDYLELSAAQMAALLNARRKLLVEFLRWYQANPYASPSELDERLQEYADAHESLLFQIKAGVAGFLHGAPLPYFYRSANDEGDAHL